MNKCKRIYLSLLACTALASSFSVNAVTKNPAREYPYKEQILNPEVKKEDVPVVKVENKVEKKNPLYDFDKEEYTIYVPGLQKEKTVYWISDVHAVTNYKDLDDVKKGNAGTGAEEYITTRYGMFVDDKGSMHSADMLSAAIAQVNIDEPDAVVFGGDLIDYYSDKNFNTLKQALTGLNGNIRRFYIRGSNSDHDVWAGLTDHGSDYAEMKQQSLDGMPNAPYLDLGGVRLVGINYSANPGISNTILKDVEGAISGTTSPVVLITHVPFDSKVESSDLEAWCRKIHNNQIYYWSDKGNKWRFADNSSMKSFTDKYIYSKDTNVLAVLAGHVHTGTWEGNLTATVKQKVFPATYRGIIGVIHLVPEGKPSKEENNSKSDNVGFIFVGESHMVIAEGGYKNSDSSMSGIHYGKNLFFAHTGKSGWMGLPDWLKSSDSKDGYDGAMKQVSSIIKGHKDITKWKIVIQHGSSVSQWPQNTWTDYEPIWNMYKSTFSDADIYALSVPPVDEKMLANSAIGARNNSTVKSYNKMIKNIAGSKYIDAWDVFMDQGKQLDGLHYEPETYHMVLDKVMKQLK